MIQPIPPGTRDILPEEMRELRTISDSLRTRFEAAGYGEVWTPTLEYEDVIRRGDERAASVGQRLFDDSGRLLVLRSDMTVPIARLVSTRYANAEPPIRLAYLGHSYRTVEPGRGESREFLQGGVELIGAPAPAGDAEVIALTIESLASVGLRRHRVGLGDGSLYRTLLAALEVPSESRLPLLETLARRDLVGLETQIDELGLSGAERDLLGTLPTLRGGPAVLERADGPVGQAVENLSALHAELESLGVADRVIFDLGLLRELGYYTGAIWEVYDPAVGFTLGGGGRYDDLLGRFGRDLPACGIALDIWRVHAAQLEEEKLA